MKKCAVIIGVNKTGRMQELSAAVSGAKQFEKWAISQNYDTVLITDDAQQVTVHDIKIAIKKFVDDSTYALMVIYFSGHGILKGPGDEKWLLSGAPQDVDEAVNVQPSKILASAIGIPHVVFISDACRSIPADYLTSQVTGSVITPNIASDNPTDVDIFYATRPGSPSLEITFDDAIKNFKGIFTDCLLEGLNGNVSEALTNIKDENGIDAMIVLSYKLDKYLRKAVPKKAREKNIQLKQDPIGEITSQSDEKYLSKFAGKKTPTVTIKKTQAPPKKSDITKSRTKSKMLLESDNAIDPLAKMLKNNNISITEYTELKELLISSVGRESYETRTGFTIIGENNFVAVITRHNFEIISDNGIKHIRIMDRDYLYTDYYEQALKDKPITLILILNNGTGIPLAVLPGFIGTVVIKDGQVINIDYFPSRGTDKYGMAIERKNEIEERRSQIVLSAKFGLFKPEGNFNDVMNFASYLRNDKGFDPTLGLYSAYSYAQVGKFNGIHSIYEYMQHEREPVIFDIAMLNAVTQPPKSITGRKIKRVSPFCPMLTQGWSYLSINYELFPDFLKELGKYLIPGLWTTFNEKGVYLINSLKDERNLI